MNESLDDWSTTRESWADDNMALDEIMKLWSNHDLDCANDEEWSESIEELDSRYENPSGPADDFSLHPEAETDAFNAVMPELQKYRECIVGNPAYDWLLGDLQTHCLLIPSSPDMMAEISRAILQGLPSQRHFSRRESTLYYKMTYTLDWDLISFLKDQEYSEEYSKALTLAITLTGSREAA